MSGRILVLSLAALTACDRAPATAPGDTPPAAPASAPVAASPETAPAEPPQAPPDTPAPSVEAQAEALVQTMESLAKLHGAHDDDCAGLAAALTEFAAEHRTQLAEQTPAQHRWIDGNAAARERLRAAMGTVATGGVACRDDAAVKAVYAELRKGK